MYGLQSFDLINGACMCIYLYSYYIYYTIYIVINLSKAMSWCIREITLPLQMQVTYQCIASKECM